jgi:hypothetical protein
VEARWSPGGSLITATGQVRNQLYCGPHRGGAALQPSGGRTHPGEAVLELGGGLVPFGVAIHDKAAGARLVALPLVLLAACGPAHRQTQGRGSWRPRMTQLEDSCCALLRQLVCVTADRYRAQADDRIK